MSLPGAVKALGLGDIRIDSALNEPLSAQIDIVGATRDELVALTAKVANRDAFLRSGADRPGFLNSATFKVGMDTQGRPVLNVRSAEPFTDPVVSFLVELRWNNGEVIREYSLLLDPPDFNSSRRLASAGTPAPTSADAGTEVPVTLKPSPVVVSDPRVAAMRQKSPPAAKRARWAEDTVPTGRTVASQRRVASGDTLRGIVRHAGVRNEVHAQRLMIAIFRTNPHAFDGNINLLHVGAVLNIPSDDSVAAIDANEAKREVRAHMTAWRLDGRPAAVHHVAANAPSAQSSTATVAQEATAATPNAVSSDALKGRVQTLERALDDMHKQLATETAALQDLKQQSGKIPATVAAPTGAVAVPTPASAPSAMTPVMVAAKTESPAAAMLAAPAAATPQPTIASAPKVAAVAPPTAATTIAVVHSPVSVEVMHGLNTPAPLVAVVGKPAMPRMSTMSFLGPVSFGVALLLAGIAYSRRRVMKAMSTDETPAIIDTPQPVIEPAALPKLSIESQAAPIARTPEPPKAAAMAAAVPAAPTARDAAPRVPTDQTTQELAVDAEALERSYLDALAIDTLGIDAADTARNAKTAEGSQDEQLVKDMAASDIVSLDTVTVTVAVDTSELDPEADNGALHTAVIDMNAVAPLVSNTSLDYNLLDLDATAEHIQAQHVQMPSALHDHVVVSERRMNIIDVLKTAIERDPNRRDLRMKLLETYYSAASLNRRAFLDVVRKLSREREHLSADDWKQVSKMGSEIAPDDILFSEPSKDNLADCA